MSRTANRWVQDTPNPDGQIFLSAAEFVAGTGAPTIVASAGEIRYDTATATATTFFGNLGVMLRTGVLATPTLMQQQYGTNANVPGPSAVANTGDPLQINGYPPFLNANNPTLNPFDGPIPKGVQINWVDVIYRIPTANPTTLTFSLTRTAYTDNTGIAGTVTNIIPLASNGLTTTFRNNIYRKRISVTTPAMITADGSTIIANLNITPGASAVASFYGMVFGLSYNFN